jgi:hypothetical protein
MWKTALKVQDSLGFDFTNTVGKPRLNHLTKIAFRFVNGDTIFTVIRSDKQPACVSNINVSEGDGTIGNISKWSLIQNYAEVQAGKNACNNVFVYGKLIKGYEQKYDNKPLEPGKTYYVSIGGNGLTGDRTFMIAR